MKYSLRSLVLVVLAAVLCSGASCGSAANPEALAALAVLRADDHTLSVGNPAVTVIEYSDFECSFCIQFNQDVFPELREKYINTGKVRWVYRHFPLIDRDTKALKAAEATECAAAQGKFWEYFDVLAQHGAALSVPELKSYAAGLGLDTTAFDACLDGTTKTQHVIVDLQGGLDAGLPGTPSFLINGQLQAGILSVSEFSAKLDAAIAAAGG